jgi:hypothetical protein
MRSPYLELAERIRGEITDLERLVQRIQHAWSHVQELSDEQDTYMDSVALNLHGFYSGLERLFELIARHVDRDLPTGKIWHRQLIQQMARDLTEVRPAVIGAESAVALDEFRRFRHLVRNIYTFNLDPDKMASLVTVLPDLFSQIKAELLGFSSFLEELAKAS